MTDITYPAAILAGLISFLSPCVLPLVPPYLSYLAGTAIEEYSEGGIRRTKRDLILAAIFFVLGFSTVFVMLGATASAFGQAVRHYLDWLSLAAGIAIIVMGLHFLGLFRLAFLFREARVQVEKPVGLWGAYVMASLSPLAGHPASARFLPPFSPSPRRRRVCHAGPCC